MPYLATNLMHDLRCDARRYTGLGGAWANWGFWAGATHRLGVFAKALPRPLRSLVRGPQKALDLLFRTAFNVRIHPDAKIGPGLCLIHPWSVLIGASVIGDNCLIFHEVTLGTNASSDWKVPHIGHNVDIYVGARILGGVTVGNEAKVGANCVVLRSVPAGATVVTAAPRVIPPSAVAGFGPRASSACTPRIKPAAE
jgi:serine acetyltransferase